MNMKNFSDSENEDYFKYDVDDYLNNDINKNN